MSETDIANAYQKFMTATRNRDSDPESFDAARIQYYGKKNGEEWIQQEKNRLLLQKIDPAIAKYRQMYKELESQTEISKAYSESAEVIRDQQSNLKSNYNNRSSYFAKLIKEQQEQKSMYDRFLELTSPKKDNAALPTDQTNIPFLVKIFINYPPEFVTLLNIIAGSIGVTIAYILYKKYKDKKSSISAFSG